MGYSVVVVVCSPYWNDVKNVKMLTNEDQRQEDNMERNRFRIRRAGFPIARGKKK